MIQKSITFIMAVSKICKQSDILKASATEDEESLEHRHKRRETEIPSTDIHSNNISDDILTIERIQCELLLQLDYSSSHVTHVYNPIDYASEPHCYFVRQYGNGKKQVLFIGMNPGPFGMAQNGVPFGDVTQVKEWLEVKGQVFKPENENPNRPVKGLSITRNEVSGTRFWSLMKSIAGSPKAFFSNCYVHNYCPLCFMTASGKNVTPPSLKVRERKQLESICDKSLTDVISLLNVQYIVCVGKYVETRAKLIAKDFTSWKIQIGSITHPSPINPSANRGDWVAMATQQLREMNVLPVMINDNHI